MDDVDTGEVELRVAPTSESVCPRKRAATSQPSEASWIPDCSSFGYTLHCRSRLGVTEQRHPVRRVSWLRLFRCGLSDEAHQRNRTSLPAAGKAVTPERG